ncbi:MAG: hypothetical protein K2O44_02535 [Clostridia bacterium]|nr:hypothetical protein [Clostridia bacterium]
MNTPSNLMATYDGNNHWLDNFAATAEWIEEDYHLNPDYVTISSITYKDNLDNPVSQIYDPATSATIPDIKNAGVYTVTMKLPDGAVKRWSDGSTGEKTFTITINQKKSVPKPKVDPPIITTPYESAGLPNLITDAGGTPGTFAWNDGEVATAGTKEYGWTFTPTDKNNFTVETDKMELEFLARELSSIAVTAYNPTATVYTDTSIATIKSYLTVQATYTDSSTETLTSYKLEVDSTDGKLHAGNNTLVISSNDDSQTITYQITGVVAKAVSAINVVQLSNSTFKYPVTAEEIKAAISRVNVQWNTGASGNLESFDDVTVSGTLNAGNSVTVTVGIDGTTATKNVTIKIDNGDFDVSGITFSGDTVTYDGNNHSIDYGGTLPAGVSVEYEYNGTKQSTPWEFANAGTYNITLSFTHSDANYNAITTTLPATLQIDKASYTMPTGYDNKKQATYTGSAISLPANWIDPDTLPKGVTVTYCEADGTTPFADKTAIDTYTVKAVFSVVDPANYKVPAPVTLTFEITDKEVYDDSGLSFTVTGVEGSGNSYTATYDPDRAISFVLEGKLVDKDGTEVAPTLTYKYEKKVDDVWTEVEAADLKGAGEYRVTVSVATGDTTYADINDKVINLTIGKATADTSETKLTPPASSGLTADGNGGYKATYNPEGNGFEFTVADIDSASIPAGATPKTPVYKKLVNGNWETVTEIKEAGEYKVVVEFEPTDTDNYNDGIAPVEITLTISDAVVVSISAALEEGAAFTTASTLDELIAKLTATAHFDNGATEAIAIENLTVVCNGLRDGGKLKAGNQSVTLTYKVGDDEFSAVVNNILVSREKVALPTFKGGLSYTGVEVKPKAADFNGYDETLMTFVTDKLQSGTVVGTYKAVFALNDYENYEWATATAVSKKVFAVAVYDGEVTLLANEAAVDWNIAKAVLTATKKDGALPVFASESYIGAFSDVVTLKYYKDEACTEEVAAEDLAHETQYFVKAELLDTENFELESSAAALTVKPFTYTTPAKELTVWEKIVKFLVTNWLWLVIAVVALILLITIIALAVRASKKKREREEQRRLEEKAERERKEERDREERRLEREERMARMNQQQSMPQMMMPQMMPQMPQMPQGQPQYAPQAQAQPVATGVGDSAQMTRIENELAAIRAEQNAAKEIASIKSDAAQQISAAKLEAEMAKLRAEMHGGEQVVQSGISLDKLTELIRTEVNTAFEIREKKAVAPTAPEGNAATQVPPDAVMTTVTTTKIDTTKKPAQPAQASAPAPASRTVVRNFVAPMPVDDGRVFDVGGFYTPVDSVDDVDNMLGDENK